MLFDLAGEPYLPPPAMPASTGPDLKKYMDKKLQIKLNGNRHITGTLRGFDQFMNLVIDEAVEQVSPTENNKIGMVVVRGNSIVMMEALEKLWTEVPKPSDFGGR